MDPTCEDMAAILWERWGLDHAVLALEKRVKIAVAMKAPWQKRTKRGAVVKVGVPNRYGGEEVIVMGKTGKKWKNKSKGTKGAKGGD